MNEEMKNNLAGFLRDQITEAEKELARANEAREAREYALEMAQRECDEARAKCARLSAQLEAAKFALERSAAKGGANDGK